MIFKNKLLISMIICLFANFALAMQQPETDAKTESKNKHMQFLLAKLLNNSITSSERLELQLLVGRKQYGQFLGAKQFSTTGLSQDERTEFLEISAEEIAEESEIKKADPNKSNEYEDIF